MADFQEIVSFACLMAFMDMCQTRSVSLTAQRLDKSKSHISTQLKTFEEITTLNLLNRHGKNVFVNEQGLSVGKSIYQLANLCHFAEAFCASGAEVWQMVTISIPMRFWGGGISLALMQAVAACQQAYPDILLYCEFIDDYSDYQYQQTPWLPDCPDIGRVDVRYTAHDAGIYAGWALLSNGEATTASPIIVPKMPWGIMQGLAQRLQKSQLHFTYSDIDYTQWLACPLADGARVLVNKLLLTDTLRQYHHVEDFDLDYLPGLQCLTRGHHAVLAYFCRHFKAGFNGAKLALRPWGQTVSNKQWRYFKVLVETQQFSEAADSLCITQPALSKQIALMEEKLGVELLARQQGRRQIVPTTIGKIVASVANGVAFALDDVARQLIERRLRERRELNIGIVPSVDEHSRLLDVVLGQISRWQEAHPDTQIHIYEAPHYQQIAYLQRLDVQMAITEEISPWLEQYPISAPETLGLVAPSAWFRETVPQSLSWSDLPAYPLVLLRRNTGIRTLIEQQCRTLGVNVQPVVESDSLNLNQRWVALGKYATILPASAVKNLLKQNLAVFIPLIPEVKRILKISYLRNRELNQDERGLLRALIDADKGLL